LVLQISSINHSCERISTLSSLQVYMSRTCTRFTGPISSLKTYPQLQNCRKVVPQAKIQMTFPYTVGLVTLPLSVYILIIKSGAPTLYYVNGDTYTEIYPATFKTYYENVDRAEIPFPPNLSMIAGNASAKSQSDVNENISAITWWCDTGADDRSTRPRAAFPRSTCGAHMQAILRFPDCVNPSDVSKYAYAAANGGKCPSGMKRMVSLRFSIRYDTRKAIPGGWNGIPPFKLACGAVCINSPLLSTHQTFSSSSKLTLCSP
jgi:hypothetical protein